MFFLRNWRLARSLAATPLALVLGISGYAYGQGFQEMAFAALVNDARVSETIAAALVEEARFEQQLASGGFQVSSSIDIAGDGQSSDITEQVAQVSLSRELWGFGRQARSLAAAEQRVESAWIEVIRTNQDVFSETSIAFANVLEADELLLIRQEFLAELNVRRETVLGRLVERLASITELQDLEGRIIDAEVAVLQAEEVTIITRLQLEQLTGHYAERIYAGELLVYPSLLPESVEQTRHLADANSPEALVSEQRFRVAKAEIEARLRENGPSLEAYGAYEYDEQNGFDVEDGQIGVRFSIPLYQGGLRNSVVEEAEMNEERALRLRQQDRAQIRQAATSAWTTLQIAKRALQTRREGLGIQEERLAAIQNELDLGFITIEALLDARAAYAEQRANLARAHFDVLRAQLTLLRAIGLASPRGS